MDKKIYDRTFWVDGETPVSADNLNKIEKGIQELSELSVRPSDLIVTEDSGIKIDTVDGKILISIDNSTVLRGDNSIDTIKVISNSVDVDPTGNNLYLLIDDNSKFPTYKIIYKGIEYFPGEIKSDFIKCENDVPLENYIENKLTDLESEFNSLLNNLKREINEDIIEIKDSLVSEINKLSKSLNTLSTKVDWVSSRVKDLEDKSNGLEIM